MPKTNNFILLNKNQPVLNFSFCNEPDDYDFVQSINEVYNLDYAPLILFNTQPITKESLNQWWINRWESAYERNIRCKNKLTSEYSATEHHNLVVKGYGLGLNDQYWIKPENSNVSWSEINYFDNPFPQDYYQSYLDEKYRITDRSSLISPDNTTGGYWLKAWIIDNGKRKLAKFAIPPYFQAPFNEFAVDNILTNLGIHNHVHYAPASINNRVISFSDNFITHDTELFTLYDICSSYNPDTIFDEVEKTIGPKLRQEFEVSMYQKFILWYLLHSMEYDGKYENKLFNTNIGFIRNVNTLKIESLAPIYDTENCLYSPTHISRDVIPFLNHIEKNLPYYFSRANLDIEGIKDIPIIIRDVFSIQDIVPQEHVDYICEMTQEKVDTLVFKVSK